ncbi:MAG: hypothetical protein COT74_02390 [Bdellovibrionales bacterium CG10_big_fil_rev_8_21_14_0_10_45_34]|nr:MAG: hypothetical protein COT74_02390 [Bdellovibrionales bacterium CG10_big_fil_rev_8_21_14_0_10_45_34]
MKGFRGTFIFGVLVFLFVGYVYYFEYKKKNEEEAIKEKEAQILDINKEKIQKLELINSDAKLVLSKVNNQWNVEQPIVDQADSSEVDRFLDQLVKAKSEAVVAEGPEADLKVYGLLEPNQKLIVQGEGEVKEEISIGNEKALGGRIYIRKDLEPKVLLASSEWEGFVTKKSENFRNKMLLRIDKNSVERLELENRTVWPRLKLGFEKTSVSWKLAQGEVRNLDPDTVQNYLNDLAEVRISEFVAEENSSKTRSANQLAMPALVVEVTTKDKAKVELRFSNKVKDDAYAVIDGSNFVAKVASSSLSKLLKTADDFRDASAPFDFDPEKVKEIELKTNLAEIHIKKQGSNWQPGSEDKKGEVDQALVGQLLSRLKELKAKEFLGSRQGRGLNKPDGEIQLKDDSGKEVFSLKWGSKTSKQDSYFARTNQLDEVITISSLEISSLPGQTLVKAPKAEEKKAETPSGASDTQEATPPTTNQ